ncbi:hypothetical protein [Atopomonas hussainii]|uniref:hypothetical protein n=1 Tax=Atopomonas hussainii TaxID=1429083 RepID=UPI0015872B8E|nr:hypothetical protein [Atopomonas hussainii]
MLPILVLQTLVLQTPARPIPVLPLTPAPPPIRVRLTHVQQIPARLTKLCHARQVMLSRIG